MKPFDPLAIPLDGMHLIEAGAGTGKTYAIASLYLRLLLERSLSVREILVVTYTVSATAELRERIRARLVQLAAALRDAEAGRSVAEAPDAPLVRLRVEKGVEKGSLRDDRSRVEDAIRSFDEAAIYTIHGFCQRVLQDHAFECGHSFEGELLTDQRALLGEVARDFFADRF